MEDLTKIAEEINSFPKPSIRIELFKEKYIPLLFDNDPSIFNYRWIDEVSMNPYLEVHVIDEFGNILHVVPPLRRPVLSNTDTRIGQITSMAVLEEGVHKGRAEQLLRNNLPKVMQFSNARSDEIQHRWNQFLTELGYGSYLIDNAMKQTSSIHYSNEKMESIELKDNEDW